MPLCCFEAYGGDEGLTGHEATRSSVASDLAAPNEINLVLIFVKTHRAGWRNGKRAA